MCKGKRPNKVEQCKIDVYHEQKWSVNKIANHINKNKGVVSKYINIEDDFYKKVCKKES